MATPTSNTEALLLTDIATGAGLPLTTVSRLVGERIFRETLCRDVQRHVELGSAVGTMLPGITHPRPVRRTRMLSVCRATECS